MASKWKKGQSGNPGGRPRTSARVREATMRLRDLAAAEVPEAFARLKMLSKQDGDLKVAAMANKEIIAFGIDRALMAEDKMQQLQARKLEAEIKVLEQQAAKYDGPAPISPAEEQAKLDALREQFPELRQVPGSDVHDA